MRILLVLGIILIVVVIAAGAWLYAPDKPRAALEARYAQPPSQFLMVAGLRLHLRDTGPRGAPAVILLHGLASSLHTWEDWASVLEADHRVIRIDLPGFGLTGADPTGGYSDARSHAVLVALMDALGIEQADLVGHSMGGRIAWGFAARHPERVERLVLVAPDGFASPGISYGAAPSVPFIAKFLPYTLPTALLRASLRPGFGDPSLASDALVERYRDMLLAPGVRQAILDRMGQHVLVRPEPLLRAITAPTLLAWGVKDGMVPATNAADYQRELADSRLVTFPGIGHLPHEEAPALSVEPVRAFLAR